MPYFFALGWSDLRFFSAFAGNYSLLTSRLQMVLMS